MVKNKGEQILLPFFDMMFKLSGVKPTNRFVNTMWPHRPHATAAKRYKHVTAVIGEIQEVKVPKAELPNTETHEMEIVEAELVWATNQGTAT